MLNLLLKPWIASCHETGDRISDYLDGELEGRSLEQLRSLGSPEQVAPEPVTVSAVISRIQRESSPRTRGG